MSVIVTDTGFAPDDWMQPVEALGVGLAEGTLAVDVPNDTDPEALQPHLKRLALIRVDFPSFSDGRGFTLARRLRRMGFAGRLRARGHVVADQYTMARRSGFDEVEISDDLARRQPEPQWRFRANWTENDYQSRLRG
ncbi:MAG: DUF934 domain-containing protein [Rhodobacteraceae bacterium]|nr:DUF934 domain-containing protein [Paracoccaceae bacterium]